MGEIYLAHAWALCVSVSEGITSPAVPACIEHWPVHNFKPPPDKCLHMFHLFVLSCMLCSAIKQDVKWHFLKKWETALFLRGGACAQMENTGEARYQPSEAVARVLIRSRRHRAAFEATQKVSESAERKCECKDFQKAQENFYKALLLLVTLRLCYFKTYLSLYFYYNQALVS